MADRKAVIKNADMSEDMQQDAVDCASQALEKYNIEKVSIAYTNPTIVCLTLHLFLLHSIFLSILGYCGLHQEGIRQEIQSYLALHCRPQLWFLRNPRNKALYLFLSWPSCNFVVQVWLSLCSLKFFLLRTVYMMAYFLI